MHVGVAGQVLAHRVGDACKLTLDDALLGFAACREQHLAVTRREALLPAHDPVRGDPQSARQRAGRRQQQLMGRSSGSEVQRGQRDRAISCCWRRRRAVALLRVAAHGVMRGRSASRRVTRGAARGRPRGEGAIVSVSRSVADRREHRAVDPTCIGA